MKKFLASVVLILFVLQAFFFTLAGAEALFEPRFPETIGLPEQSGYLTKDGAIDDAYFEAYDLWAAARFFKKLAPGKADALKGYFDDISREILSDENQKNKVFSPVNVYLALSMLAEITDGSTREEILDLLCAENIESLRAQANAVFLSVYENDGQTTSVPAASVWLRNDISYIKDSLGILSDEYFASSFSGEMGSADYDQMIQKWLSDATGGLLEEAAKNISFDKDTIIALASSLYFKAGWTNEFSLSLTEEDVFFGVSGDTRAEFMKKGGSDTYYWGDGFGAAALPLTNGGKMWFILPDEGVSPESLFDKGDVSALTQSPDQWQNQKRLIVNKSIPKFDVTGENDLIASLKNLGVRAAFDPDASDFTPLTDIREIAVSRVQHDARVKIDEKGVEAAAYTVIMAYATSARPPEEEMDFIVNRPFAFVITSGDNLPLFMGIVNQVGQ